ncbi:hypothetical protein NM688_g4126 [Phlebia brevispora]|uniref:Uncharacterized protein n=1 Tax=Phlebia brevispora TaxID=194682 RepID=A0ACC1T3M1_9APHY|nr:hypothetical protein NM688_g4126 [Phlebia brevispora]
MARKELPTGLYFVRNVQANKWLGHVRTQWGVGPEKVILLPDGSKTPFFHVEKNEDETYVISVSGLTTIEIEGKVYCMPLAHADAPKWAIEHVEHPDNEFLYTIKNPNFPQGWTVNQQTAYAQISVDPFASTTPDGAVFEISPAERIGQNA